MTTNTEDYTVRVKRYERTDPRLGRNVRHDSRSLLYRTPGDETDPTTLTSVRHTRNVPVLDQGDLGSCTGNAATGCLGTGAFSAAGATVLSTTDAAADEAYAVGVYGAATALDPWPGTYPPDDTGSDGLSVAKVLQSRGLISGYTHALSLNAALAALSKQPTIVGIPWHEDSFTPQLDGRLPITGDVAGGHEVVLDELDVENRRAWLTNSWGTSWGLDGRAYLTWDDLGTLLADDGDCTVFVPNTEPAPQPTPVEPVAPTPTAQDTFVAQAAEWLSHRHSGRNRTFARDLQAYLDSLGG